MRSISFVTANYVGRIPNYQGGSLSDWGKFDAATVAVPPDQQFPAIAAEVAAVGFTGLDLWTAHCHWQHHGVQSIPVIKQACAKHNLTITSYVGGFEAATLAQVEAAFSFMSALGVSLFAGVLWGQSDEATASMVDAVAGQCGVKWAFENHSQRTTEEILAKIGSGRYRNCGIALDTGWCGTQGIDALKAVKAVRPYLLAVHLKDVKEVGSHDTCALGAGIVPVEQVVRYLVETDWSGSVGIEHEPFDRDPMPEVSRSLVRLRDWLA